MGRQTTKPIFHFVMMIETYPEGVGHFSFTCIISSASNTSRSSRSWKVKSSDVGSPRYVQHNNVVDLRCVLLHSGETKNPFNNSSYLCYCRPAQTSLAFHLWPLDNQQYTIWRKAVGHTTKWWNSGFLNRTVNTVRWTISGIMGKWTILRSTAC